MKDKGQDLPSCRARTIQAVSKLCQGLQETAAAWFKTLSPHVAAAYTFDEGKQIVQIPLLMHLLRGCGYGDADNLENDLN